MNELNVTIVSGAVFPNFTSFYLKKHDAMSHYLMDDPREAQRLADKVVPAKWVSKYLVPLELRGKRILDVGCGPGHLASAIAEQICDVQVVGVDQSDERITKGQKQTKKLKNLTLRCGDAMSLPFEDATFDFVMCRLLMEYLPHKHIAVNEFARVLKPGGRVFLQDLDGQLVWHYPPDHQLQKNIEATLKVLEESGFDPFVGRKLAYLCTHAGFHDVKVQIEPYHQIIGRIDPETRRLWELKLDIAKPIAISALGSETAANEMNKRFLKHLDREDSLTYSVVFSVLGSK